ncbi:MAG: ribonuclease H-like domain-containing protein [Saprospiraceae bacterium]
MFLDIHHLKKCLFIDIETVSQYKSFTELDEEMQALWVQKCQYFQNPHDGVSDPAKHYEEKAGIFAEFGKIVCISMGFLNFEQGEPNTIRIRTLKDTDEREILLAFVEILKTHYYDPESSKICGHNIKEFDIPYICRRMVVHAIPFPPILDISGKKPWQTAQILDTMDLWRFGDYKHYTSLRLLSGVLGIPSPKDDIDGSMVGPTYWNENDLDRIAIYCEKDVITVIQIILRYAGKSKIPEDNIIILN